MTKVQLAFAGQPAWSSKDLPAEPEQPKSRSHPETTSDPVQLEMELIFPIEEEFLAMSDSEVLEFREALIKRAFRAVVDGRVSRQQRREWGEWIASDELHPFSFAVCAIETGVNPQELREVLVTFIRRHHKSFAAEIPFTA